MVEYTKLLAKNVSCLVGKRFLNKTGRGVGITRLNEALVPIAKAIETTGHHTMDAFKKYNHEKQILSERALNASCLKRCKMVSLFYINMCIMKN